MKQWVEGLFLELFQQVLPHFLHDLEGFATRMHQDTFS